MRLSPIRAIIGGLIILIGVVALLNNFGVITVSAGQVAGIIWGLLLVAVGVWVIGQGRRVRQSPASISRTFGDTYVGRSSWDLRELYVNSVIGDVHVDVTRATIPEREGLVRVSGIVGDIEVLLPREMGVSARGSAFIGTVRVLGQKADGFFPERTYTSTDFESAEKRVVIKANLVIGDILVTRVD